LFGGFLRKDFCDKFTFHLWINFRLRSNGDEKVLFSPERKIKKIERTPPHVNMPCQWHWEPLIYNSV